MRVGIGIGLNYQRASSGGPPALILDSLSAGAAYSTRKLRTAYAGAAIRVRRSSDNVEADIGFSGNSLDTAALTAHVGANSGFIVTWYDQSTNGRNLTQATTTRQPRIVNAGTIEVVNSVPAPFFDGTNSVMFNSSPFLYAAGAMTMCTVCNNAVSGTAFFFGEESSTTSNPSYRIHVGISGDTDALGITVRNDANVNQLLANKIADLAFNSTLKNLTVRDTGSTMQAYLNGVNGTDLAYTRAGSLTVDRFAIGGRVSISGSFVTSAGHIAEVICFPSSLSNADMNAVNASQGGAYGISVVPFLTPVEKLAVVNGTGDGGSSFAVGLTGPVDYSEPLFLDRAKQSRGWVKDFVAFPSANLDSEGALNSLISGDTTAMFFFCAASEDGVVDGPTTGRGGRFRVTFTGAATISGFGITDLTMIDANTYEFDCDWNGNKWLMFTPTAYPIKVTLVKTTDIAAHAAGGIFRQEFLDSLPSGGCFRFMDWMITNNSPIVNWSDYPVFTSQRWNRIPFEVMLALCEAKSATPWFNIPHQATDAFISSAADYVRDNFAGKARWELSNEIWNFQFTQAGYFGTLATSQWGVSGGTVWLSAAGKRFAQMMQLINTSFTGQTSRVIGVLGGQAANSSVASAILDAPQWLASEPGSYVAPYTLAEEWAIAPYINWSGGTTVQGNAIKTQLDASHAAAVTYFKGMFPASLAQSKAWIDSHIPFAADRNRRLTMYEYNNHYDLANPGISASSLWSAGSPVAGALDVFIEATYSQEMADAQDELRAYFKAQNGSLMSFFVDMGQASRFGTWGAKTHFGHDSAIWNDLLSWHTANPRWWAQ